MSYYTNVPAERRKEIAALGGKAAHAKGTAHKWTSEKAREAGRKGGKAAHAKGTAYRLSPEKAQEAGKKGGQKAAENRRKKQQEEYVAALNAIRKFKQDQPGEAV